ncbi:MAG TPA: hypothetical protein VHH90_04090 [Polyangia bacterium]|nr:hypothetical protein [Polyangia bacterium]
MEKRAGGAAALLAVVLVTAWMFAVGYNQSNWLSWVDLGIGIVVLGGLGTTTSTDMQGTATWPMAGFVLIGAWLFALAAGSPHWLTWLTFAIGLAFVLLTFGWLIVSAEGPSWHRRHARV